MLGALDTPWLASRSNMLGLRAFEVRGRDGRVETLSVQLSTAVTLASLGVDKRTIRNMKQWLQGRSTTALLTDQKASDSSSLERIMYCDAEFPASPTALYSNPTQHLEDLSSIVWKRPKDITQTPCSLFVDGSEPGDVIQGALGDCWFLSALSVVATRADLVNNLVVSFAPDHGKYTFRFYKHGKWVHVTVDDQLPCSSKTNTPIFAKGKQLHELWVPLIEKAYAKLHSSYEALEGGVITDALVDLTGGVGQTYSLSELGRESVWQLLCKAKNERWLIGSARTQSDGPLEADDGSGLLLNHAYGVLDHVSLPSGDKLVCIRNPWGRKEWTGRYSDGSKDWTDELLAMVHHHPANDGLFWMLLDDFVIHFTTLYLVRLFHDGVGHVWQRHLVLGEWHSESAGGDIVSTNPNWIHNPQWRVHTSKKTKIFVSLSQHDTRMPPHEGHVPRRYIPVCIAVLRSTDGRRRSAPQINEAEVVSRVVGCAREVVLQVSLEAGCDYIVVVGPRNAGECAPFVMTLYAKRPVKLHALPPNRGEQAAVLVSPSPMEQLTGRARASQSRHDAAVASAKAHCEHVEKRSKASLSATGEEVTVKYENGDEYRGTMKQGQRDGWGVHKYANGDEYRGQFRNGKIHGQGTLTLKDGTQYSGDFDEGTMHGHGVLRTAQFVYTGEFCHGVFHGYGRQVFSDGDVYEGEFSNDKFEGQGSYRTGEGASYHGHFANGKFHGRGVYRFAEGDEFYVGEFCHGAFEGEGEYHYANGDVYRGRHRNGTPDGKGVLNYRNGDVYDGEFKNGKRHGRGVYRYANGSVYEGEYCEGQREGRGTLRTADGVYTGLFKNGHPHGRGRFKFTDGDDYEGEFAGGLFHGIGVLIRANGDRYEGEFHAGRRHGMGVLMKKSGDRYEGQFVGDTIHGKGRFAWANGDVYEGEFAHGKPNGHGVYSFASGAPNIEGEFRDGKPVVAQRA